MKRTKYQVAKISNHWSNDISRAVAPFTMAEWENPSIHGRRCSWGLESPVNTLAPSLQGKIPFLRLQQLLPMNIHIHMYYTVLSASSTLELCSDSKYVPTTDLTV